MRRSEFALGTALTQTSPGDVARAWRDRGAKTKGGPSVVLAFLVAGLLVLPAALSKAEMATAMSESGGTYLYIDRSMGPLMGTITGLGAWFSLVFKSAFALVGLGAYFTLIVPLPAGQLQRYQHSVPNAGVVHSRDRADLVRP